MKKCYNIQYNIKTSNQAVASWRQEQGEINYNKKADKAMTVIANTLFKEHKNGDEITSALSDVQLGASTKFQYIFLEYFPGLIV